MTLLQEEQVRDALRTVKDPELGKDLVSLNMVRDIQVKGKAVSLTVVLTIAGCPLRNTIQQDVVAAVAALGAEPVEITWAEMTPEERADLSQRLRAEKKPGAVGPQGARPVAGWLQEQNVTCIAVVSGKGGVGKSTVAANLAVAMARLGHRVGLVDADIHGFSIPEMMGVTRRPVVVGETVMPVEQHGVQVMSMGFFVDDNAPVVWRGPMLGKMLRNFFIDVHWNQITHLILDLPPGTGDVALDIHQMIPQCKQIVVTTPHPSAAYVAIRAGSMALYQTKHELLGVVENMSWYENRLGEQEYPFGKGGGKKVADTLGVPLLAKLPLMAMNDVGDSKEAVYTAPHPLAQRYEDLAKAVERALTEVEARRAKEGLPR